MGISGKFLGRIVSKSLCFHNSDKYLQIVWEYLFMKIFASAVLFKFLYLLLIVENDIAV